MNSGPHDPRDIPVLTDAIEDADVEVQIDVDLDAAGAGAVADTVADAVADAEAREANLRALQSAIVAETLKLADSLLHQAARDIEATLFENLYDRLRAELPELINRILQDQAPHAAADPNVDD